MDVQQARRRLGRLAAAQEGREAAGARQVDDVLVEPAALRRGRRAVAVAVGRDVLCASRPPPERHARREERPGQLAAVEGVAGHALDVDLLARRQAGQDERRRQPHGRRVEQAPHPRHEGAVVPHRRALHQVRRAVRRELGPHRVVREGGDGGGPRHPPPLLALVEAVADGHAAVEHVQEPLQGLHPHVVAKPDGRAARQRHLLQQQARLGLARVVVVVQRRLGHELRVARVALDVGGREDVDADQPNSQQELQL
mmetsp:Transcript_18783/g.66339  ORF Transcript_18783/g.66339 Transcript_18783/m.66339 type:complete len:255 (+) Transcript_18783:1158-1922(+)